MAIVNWSLRIQSGPLALPNGVMMATMMAAILHQDVLHLVRAYLHQKVPTSTVLHHRQRLALVQQMRTTQLIAILVPPLLLVMVVVTAKLLLKVNKIGKSTVNRIVHSAFLSMERMITDLVSSVAELP